MMYNNTDILTCLQLTLQDNTTSEFQSPEAAIVNVVLRSLTQLIILPFTLVLNLLVIIVVAKTKKLQTPPFYAALQLVCCNITMAVVSASSILSSAIGGGWVLGGVTCALGATIFSILTSSRILILLVLATDRALYVFVPIAYPRIQKKVLVILSLTIWFMTTIISIMPLPGLMDCYGFRSSSLVCLFAGHCHSHCKVYIPARYISTVLPACILPSVLYGCMYRKARKLKKSSTSASKENTKTDHNVTITFFLLFASTILLLLPSGLLALFTTITSPSEIVTTLVTVISTTILRASTIVDAIFLLRNETVKVALYKLIRDTAKKWRRKN